MKSLAERALCGTAILLSLALTWSCASEGREGVRAKSAVLRGMVYNENRAPVGDATVNLVQRGTTVASTRSDVRGHYVLPDVDFGPVTLRFAKQGYEPLEWSFTFDGPAQVVYVRMVDLSELLDDAANSIKKRSWATATSYLDRIDKLEPDNIVSSYLRAVLLARQGNADLAAALLEKLAADKGSSFAIELTLADLYQYKLAQPDKALVHLKIALTIQDDVEVENRVAVLEKE